LRCTAFGLNQLKFIVSRQGREIALRQIDGSFGSRLSGLVI